MEASGGSLRLLRPGRSQARMTVPWLAVQSLNVAFMVGLGFAVAASANLPVILYSLYWRRFTATGAVLALLVGTGTAVASVLLGPAVIGAKGLILSSTAPLIPPTNPGIISIPAGFAAGWLGSLFLTDLGRKRARRVIETSSKGALKCQS